jgi:hypothetical protein
MLQFLAPKFLNDFDKKLLLNYPFWYIAKIHYIFYFTLLMWLLSYGIGCILPIQYMSYNPMKVVDTWIFMFGVLAAILFCVWVYYLTIYNNENRFGKYSAWDDVKLLGILMVGIMLLISFSYPMQIRVKTRLANVFTDAELAQQYNALNLGHKYRTSNEDDFQYCGYDVHDNIVYNQLKKDKDFVDGYVRHDLSKYKRFTQYSSAYFSRYDRSLLFSRTDFFKESNEYQKTLLNDREIEHTFNLHKTDKDKLDALVQHFNVIKKYNPIDYAERYSPQDYLDNYNHYEKTCVHVFPRAFNLDEADLIAETDYLPSGVDDVDHYMSNIYKAKFSLPPILDDFYLLFCFYFSFFISLFVILFRNNKWQHYLVSVVTFILLAIILGIVSLASGYPYNQYVYPSLALLAWLVAAVISIRYYFNKDRYSIIGSVATNLFYICLPVMPFLVCMYCHEAFGWLKCTFDYSLTDEYQIAYNRLLCDWYNRKFLEVVWYSQIIGIAVFILIVMPLYKLFFAKQKALPKEK